MIAKDFAKIHYMPVLLFSAALMCHGIVLEKRLTLQLR